MARILTRRARRIKIHGRIRKLVRGTGDRPRLCVFRSLKHTYAQIVDDEKGRTLISASTLEGGKGKPGSNIEAAKGVGQLIASKAQAQGVSSVVFDRGGYIYHGRVKALAEAAREAGLKF
ncbi:MAG: 50S ribosomal protein L18 [Acidobacteriota bacterium]|nr:50S ribosomal protein L18 [Acidobacteriota bacterium]